VGGLRHLVMDMGYWEELESGNQSARVAFVITAVLAVLAGVLVW
jgi:succinate dehydrogenase / fumarate reductase cytochrome b subunit